jgi:hypothetical protein
MAIGEGGRCVEPGVGTLVCTLQPLFVAILNAAWGF